MDIPMPPVVQPRGLMEYANEASKFRNSQQQNQLNDLKLQYAPQQMEMERQTNQAQLENNQLSQDVTKHKLYRDIATEIVGKVKNTGLSEDDPRFNDAFQQISQAYAPIVAKLSGTKYDPSKPVDYQSVKQLAGPTAQEQQQSKIAGLVAEQQALAPGKIAEIEAEAKAKNKLGQQPVNWTPVQDGAYQLNPQTGEVRPTGISPKQTEPKPLQEWQVKQVDFLNRTTQANDIIENIGKNYSPSFTSFSKWTEGVPLVGKAVNAALSPNEQQINQAQRQFINSTLRRESGAAIGKDEFESAQQQYFPMPNDSAETLAQKAQARATVIQGLKTGLPENLMPQTAMPQNSDNISIDIKHPENLSEEDRQALQADINATKATNKPQGKLKFIGFE